MRKNLRLSLAGTAVVATAAVAGITVSLPADASQQHAAKPTIVLVHGAFADSSGWDGVIDRLTKDGYHVRAAADQLQGPASDAASVKSLVDSIGGPVILVGHSYGGAVISTAAAGDPNVKALVYVAAYTPDTGESLATLSAKPVAHPVAQLPLIQVPTATGVDLYVDAAKFRSVFAADVPAEKVAEMAATQRPLNAAAFTETAKVAAWRTIPSWYMIANQDKVIGPDLERFMATRAKSHTVAVNSSHAMIVSRPADVTRVIEEAAH